jgi:ADP-ribose pyrophosphatase YjhB (NUDIX family)
MPSATNTTVCHAPPIACPTKITSNTLASLSDVTQMGAMERVVRKDDYSTRVDVLMVTTAKGKWTFPKGLVEVNETSRSTAHKEVLEEAGVKGTLYEDSYPPKFRMVKKDWGGIECEVTVFKMLVTRILAADDQEWLVSGVAAAHARVTHGSRHGPQSQRTALQHGSHTRTRGGGHVFDVCRTGVSCTTQAPHSMCTGTTVRTCSQCLQGKPCVPPARTVGGSKE